MSFASNSLKLIRAVTQRSDVIPRPDDYQEKLLRSGTLGQGLLEPGPQQSFSSHLTESVRLEEDLMSRYADYEEMDQFPELGAAVDLFADDATVQDILTGKSLWYEAEDETIEHILNDMLDVNLKIENDLWEMARALCKNGNLFTEMLVLDGVGVVKMKDLAPAHTRRIEDINGYLHGFMNDPSMNFAIQTESFFDRLNQKSAGQIDVPQMMGSDLLQVYEPWEVIHMKLKGRSRQDLYGHSVLEAARYAWKRLALMEDSMLLYKVSRSPQRYVFYVDVGDVPPNQARGYLNRIKNDFKKTKFIDPQTGKPSFRFNPLSQDDDIFIPVRKDRKGTDVEVLAGPEGQSVEDTEYFLNKVFAALKIPKSYLGADETVGRANLSQMDVRLCRSVMRVQRELKNGFNHLARVDLAAKNIDPDRTEFQPHMVIPSGVFEMAQIEVEQAKLDLGDKYRQANFSEYWIYSKILGLSDEDIHELQRQRAQEKTSNLGPEEAYEVRKRLPDIIDRSASRIHRPTNDLQQKILDEVAAGNTAIGRKLRDLRGLTNDIRSGLHTRKRR